MPPLIRMVVWILLVKDNTQKRRLINAIGRTSALVLGIAFGLPPFLEISDWYDHPAAKVKDGVWASVTGTKIIDSVLEMVLVIIL